MSASRAAAPAAPGSAAAEGSGDPGPASAPPRAPGRAIRALGRHTLVYTLGVIASKLASFIMLPVYTRFLSPSDYGVLELLSMTIDVIGTIAGVGLASGVFKFYADFQDADEHGEVVSTAALATLGIAAFTAALGLLAAPLLARAVFGHGPGSNPLYFRLFFLIYMVQTAEAVPLLLLRARQESVAFVSVNVAKLVAMLTLNVVFVVLLHRGVEGVLLSNLIVTSTSAAGLTAYTLWRTGGRFSRPKLGLMVRFGAPMVPWLLSNFVLVFSDRYFLNHFAGTAVVGIYSLAYKFAFVLTAFAFTPFQMVWEPQRFAVARSPDAQEVYPRVFTYLNLALGGAALLMALYVTDLLRVMAAPAFLPAARLVPILLASQVIYHWTAFSNLGLFLRERTGMLGRLAVVAVVATLGLNFLLIPRYGAWGAAAATLIAYGIRFALVYATSQRAYRMRYDWPALIRLYALLGAALAARHAVGVLPILPSLAYSSALALATGAAIYHFVLRPGERAWLRGRIMRSRAALAAAGD